MLCSLYMPGGPGLLARGPHSEGREFRAGRGRCGASPPGCLSARTFTDPGGHRVSSGAAVWPASQTPPLCGPLSRGQSGHSAVHTAFVFLTAFLSSRYERKQILAERSKKAVPEEILSVSLEGFWAGKWLQAAQVLLGPAAPAGRLLGLWHVPRPCSCLSRC